MSLMKLDPNFKPAFDGEKIAQDLVYKISKIWPVSSAYLFGSCSNGKNTIHSDLDILLIVSDLADIKFYYKIVSQPFFSTVAVDWIIKKESDFEKEKIIGGVSMIAFRTGIEIKVDGSI